MPPTSSPTTPDTKTSSRRHSRPAPPADWPPPLPPNERSPFAVAQNTPPAVPDSTDIERAATKAPRATMQQDQRTTDSMGSRHRPILPEGSNAGTGSWSGVDHEIRKREENVSVSRCTDNAVDTSSGSATPEYTDSDSASDSSVDDDHHTPVLCRADNVRDITDLKKVAIAAELKIDSKPKCDTRDMGNVALATCKVQMKPSVPEFASAQRLWRTVPILLGLATFLLGSKLVLLAVENDHSDDDARLAPSHSFRSGLMSQLESDARETPYLLAAYVFCLLAFYLWVLSMIVSPLRAFVVDTGRRCTRIVVG